MIRKKLLINKLKKALIGCFFVFLGLFGSLSVATINSTPVSAITPGENTTVTTDNCRDSLESIGWLVCPTTGKISEAVDWLYGKIEGILTISPTPAKDGSPIYEVWKYIKGITNIVFIIFLLVVIYSQITGLGINNYGIKKALPKLIVAAILVNLSFLICQLAVDTSNIIGNGLRGVFDSIAGAAIPAAGGGEMSRVAYAEMYTSIAGGAALAVGGGMIAFETGAIWMLIPVVLGALVAVVSGLITIALRQAVVALLIMVAPFAMVANILPNTEQWFKKWKDLLFKMLIFYPMFSLLFGASQLAGFAIIASANDGFGVLLGTAVQIFPLFFSWSLMKMSGTFLGGINAKLNSLAAGPLAKNRAWADSHRQLTKRRYLASERPITPSLRLMQFIDKRKVAREEELKEKDTLLRERGLAYRARQNYRRGNLDGKLSKKGEETYGALAQSMSYQNAIMRNKNNFEKGFSHRYKEGTTAHSRVNRLDTRNMNAADVLKIEEARGEKISYTNALKFHERMEGAINAHVDLENKYKIDKSGRKYINPGYKFHFDPNDIEATAEMARYNVAKQIMEGDAQDVHFAAAAAAQAYDTQKKIVETKMQKYFELSPPTKELELRLNELTKLSKKELAANKRASDSIDIILPGLRILNQRGDTDLVKAQLDNILDKNIGGGLELGTHASQALASFLMFEVKDNDFALRRFGKYINLETARVFNNNNRKVMDVTYDEYIKGYHDGEPITEDNPDGRMYAKKSMKQLVEGTSLDNIERTALSNLDDSLKKAYGFNPSPDHKNDPWDVEGYFRKRDEIQTAFEPAFLSSSLKWLSGSEQINSGVKFWTGYEIKPKKNGAGELVFDEYGDLEYELKKSWEDSDSGFNTPEAKKMAEKYFRDKTHAYFKDQTTGQILGMRTDYRDATMEHLLAEYLEDKPEEKAKYEAEKAQYERAVAELQTKKYEGLTVEEARQKREQDRKKLDAEFKKTKMGLAGKQFRKIMGETGKLEQVYRTRRSGAANNAKDWLRGWFGLDDENMMSREVAYYKKERRKQKDEEQASNTGDDAQATTRVYGAEDQLRFESELELLYENNQDVEVEKFYNMLKNKIAEWFGGNLCGVEIEFRKFYENAKRSNKLVEPYDLKTKLDDLLHDANLYPDA